MRCRNYGQCQFIKCLPNLWVGWQESSQINYKTYKKIFREYENLSLPMNKSNAKYINICLLGDIETEWNKQNKFMWALEKFPIFSLGMKMRNTEN